MSDVLRPDLLGRCGTCARFVRVVESIEPTGEVRRKGECLLGVWQPPLYENNTCSQYVQKGTFKASPPATTRASRGASRPRSAPGAPPQPFDFELPEELLDMDKDEFKNVLREVLREELGVSNVALGARWEGGEVVLKPGREGTQEKRVPIESLFAKIVMIRDRLRVLEQKINANSKLTSEEKIQMQQYVTGCYGSLTTFNVLFADKADQFVGQKGDD